MGVWQRVGQHTLDKKLVLGLAYRNNSNKDNTYYLWKRQTANIFGTSQCAEEATID